MYLDVFHSFNADVHVFFIRSQAIHIRDSNNCLVYVNDEGNSQNFSGNYSFFFSNKNENYVG